MDHAQEDQLHQDLVNLHQIQGVQYEDEVDSDEDFDRRSNGSAKSDYDDPQFLEDYKDHDWSSAWNELGMDEHKFKVNSDFNSC